MTAPTWLTVLDDTIRACATHRRADLAQRLLDRRARLLEPGSRVVVLGGTGQGKSQLVNALVNAPVCAVGDDTTTNVPAVVRHADEPSATVVTRQRAIGGLPARVDAVTAQANRLAARGDVLRAEIGLPRALLGAGLVLVDAPPVGEAGCPRTELAMGALADADATLLVSAATSGLTDRDVDLLTQVVRLCPTVIVVLTKTDIVPNWRSVADGAAKRLAVAGIPATVVPVSSALRLAAARSQDKALNAESGFADLITVLRKEILADPNGVTARAVAAASRLTVDELIAPLRAEFDAPPEELPVLAEWHAAGQRVERLQRESARWQTVLADDVADLVSDVEYDLRDRTRRLLREVDDYFEEADPAKVWDEFDDWMRDELTAAAEVNSDWLLRRFEWTATRVAREVVPDAVDLPASVLREVSAAHVDALRTPHVERFTPVQKLFVGLRGSYSGLLMSGLATTLAGLPLINPISLGAGAAFGMRSVWEERGARLKRRQAVAKTAAQRHVDDFFLRYGKESRDAARVIHRALRDRFTEVAHELRVAATESARVIKREVDAATAARSSRAAEVRRGLEQLAALRGRVDALQGTRAAIAAKGLTA